MIPAAPDAWVWLGDLAYMDIPPMDCTAAANADHPDCNCKPTYLKHPSTGCLSGNVQNAQRKVEAIIRSPGYRAFVEYMCPGAALRGDFPPPGNERGACPRPILGVYDDHDFGWNNGNGEELANRNAIKQARPHCTLPAQPELQSAIILCRCNACSGQLHGDASALRSTRDSESRDAATAIISLAS